MAKIEDHKDWDKKNKSLFSLNVSVRQFEDTKYAIFHCKHASLTYRMYSRFPLLQRGACPRKSWRNQNLEARIKEEERFPRWKSFESHSRFQRWSRSSLCIWYKRYLSYANLILRWTGILQTHRDCNFRNTLFVIAYIVRIFLSVRRNILFI